MKTHFILHLVKFTLFIAPFIGCMFAPRKETGSDKIYIEFLNYSPTKANNTDVRGIYLPQVLFVSGNSLHQQFLIVFQF